MNLTSSKFYSCLLLLIFFGINAQTIEDKLEDTKENGSNKINSESFSFVKINH